MGWFERKKPALTPPQGYTDRDIRTQSSICTGETLIGFWNGRTGELVQAVCVRSAADIAAYYRRYGFEPPKG